MNIRTHAKPSLAVQESIREEFDTVNRLKPSSQGRINPLTVMGAGFKPGGPSDIRDVL
jgi:hypothetical protein